MYVGIIAYFLLALCFSFLCSLWEAVLLSISPSYMQLQVEGGKSIGAILEDFKSNIDRPLAAILSLNTVAHTVGALGVGEQAVKIWGETSPYITGVVVPLLMTAGILIFSEIVPKTIGATYWRALAPFTVRSLRVLILVLRPIVWACQGITKFLGPKRSESVFSRSDFLAMAHIGSKEGQLDTVEMKLIENLLHFKKFKAKDVMTPRTVLVTAHKDMTIQEFYDLQRELAFSRIPLRAGPEDERIIGYVLKDEVLEFLLEGMGDEALYGMNREIISVEEDFDIFKLFNKFINKKELIAVVHDVYGGVSGIVTMEDIIETLLGAEIVDEMDKTIDMQALAKKRWDNISKEKRH